MEVFLDDQICTWELKNNLKKRKEIISNKNTICDQIVHKIQMENKKFLDFIERISINT